MKIKSRRKILILALFLGMQKGFSSNYALHELKVEQTPRLELPFPKDPPCALKGAEFSFTLPEEPPLSDKQALLKSSAWIVPFALATPLTEIALKEENNGEAGSLAESEHFDVQVEYAPKRARPGYVFKITLTPRTDVHFKRIRQNFYFLLDRSNSISNARYALNKKAVSEAIPFLKPEDTFNILLFDDHVVRFQEKPIPYSEEALVQARAFLEKQDHGGYFAATELYASLGKIVPQDVPEEEVNSAILLSDGESYLSQEKQRLTIGRWIAQNKGKVALYTLASGCGNNLPLLDLLSAFNKGFLIYTQEHQDVSERLAYLMKAIQNPIGKQMVATAICPDKSMSVLLQPKQARIPDLYQNRPFVIYGTTNKLSDFALFVQGRYYNSYFDIKKIISFEQAKIGSYSVEKGWTQLVVQEYYERYFEDGNVSHLEAAKQLLRPLNLTTPLIGK